MVQLIVQSGKMLCFLWQKITKLGIVIYIECLVMNIYNPFYFSRNLRMGPTSSIVRPWQAFQALYTVSL
jgi:hypothetical protein